MTRYPIDEGPQITPLETNEKSVRDSIAALAKYYVGTKEHTAKHREIIDIYNSKGPYPITENEPWCAAFSGAIAILGNITDYVPLSKSCSVMIQGFKDLGEWVEDDSYVPQVGEYIFFIWSANHKGFVNVADNQEDPDHVGIVVEVNVSKGSFFVVDGNNGNDEVGLREVFINSSIIRGFGTPRYSAISGSAIAGKIETATKSAQQRLTTPTAEIETNDNPLNISGFWDEVNRVQTSGVWRRSYQLVAGVQGQALGFTIGDSLSDDKQPLRIQFDVEKADLTEPNNTRIKIWNLGHSKRAVLETPNCYVILKAGYGGRVAPIAEGTVLWCVDSLESGNLVTEIEMLDEGRAQLRDAYISISYGQSISGRRIVDDIITQMGISTAGVYISPNAKFFSYSSGYSYVGTAINALDQICKENGLVCSILNGSIDIRQPYEPRTMSAVVLNSQTGLIGIPKKLMTREDGDTFIKGWSVQFLLNNSIDLGSFVRLESKFVPGGYGYYCVQKLNVSGDNYEGSWVCSATLSDPLYGLNPGNNAVQNRSGIF